MALSLTQTAALLALIATVATATATATATASDVLSPVSHKIRPGKRKGQPSSQTPDISTTIFNGVTATGPLVTKTVFLELCGRRSCGSCTGSVVESRWVVTAAHCLEIDGRPIRSMRVTVDGVPYTGSFVHIHRGYQSARWSLEQDIGLVELSAPFASAVSKFALAADATAADTVVDVAGFGQTSPDSGASATLQRGTTTLLASSECLGYEDDGFICSDTQRATGVICPGDSGGPLFLESGGAFTLVGVNSAVLLTSSTSFECGDSNRLHIYADVTLSKAAIDDCVAGGSGACVDTFRRYRLRG